jgi:hypothetical protein
VDAETVDCTHHLLLKPKGAELALIRAVDNISDAFPTGDDTNRTVRCNTHERANPHLPHSRPTLKFNGCAKESGNRRVAGIHTQQHYATRRHSMRTTIDARAGRLARSTLQTVTIAALLLLTATYATAAEVVITQASVMAAGGFPYTITEPGSYTLGSNLAVPAHTGAIVIKAENVNLNLGGFTIEGPVTCAGRPGPVTSCSPLSPSAFGVFSHGDNITISNGSIVGFAGYGLLLGGQGELVEGVHLKFNGIAGVWLAGGTVRNCSAIRNGNGFQAGEGGAGGGGVLEGNTASFNQ